MKTKIIPHVTRNGKKSVDFFIKYDEESVKEVWFEGDYIISDFSTEESAELISITKWLEACDPMILDNPNLEKITLVVAY